MVRMTIDKLKKSRLADSCAPAAPILPRRRFGTAHRKINRFDGCAEAREVPREKVPSLGGLCGAMNEHEAHTDMLSPHG